MKKIFLIGFCFLIPLMMQMGYCSADDQASPKWVFHFDVNKTITAIDSAKGYSYEEMVNSILAEKYHYYWDDTLPEEMSYEQYVKEFCGFSKEEAKQHILQFVDFINGTNHPLKDDVNEDVKLLQDKLLSQDTLVLASFYRFLSYVENANIDYAIILRSFGNDLNDVVEEINEILGRTFLETSAYFLSGELYTEEGLISSPQEIYSYFSECSNLIVQDDYYWWESHGKHSHYGKPFYYNGDDKDVVHVSFDDNINGENEENNIVAPLNAMTGNPLFLGDLLEIGVVHSVDPFQAIVDDEYYVNRFLHLQGQRSKAFIAKGTLPYPHCMPGVDSSIYSRVRAFCGKLIKGPLWLHRCRMPMDVARSIVRDEDVWQIAPFNFGGPLDFFWRWLVDYPSGKHAQYWKRDNEIMQMLRDDYVLLNMYLQHRYPWGEDDSPNVLAALEEMGIREFKVLYATYDDAYIYGYLIKKEDYFEKACGIKS